MEYSLQCISNGQMICIYPNKQEAEKAKETIGDPNLEVVSTDLCKCELHYIEFGGPNGYGCNCPDFITYGSIKKVLTNLVKYVQGVCRTFGPDIKDIRDYLQKCHLYINGKDKSEWFWKVTINNMSKTIFI